MNIATNRLPYIWDMNTRKWVDLQNIITRFPPFFQRNPRGIANVFRKLQGILALKGWLEKLESDDHLGHAEINPLKEWYGEESKDLSCKFLYKTIMNAKQTVEDQGNKDLQKWWELLFKSDHEILIAKLKSCCGNFTTMPWP